MTGSVCLLDTGPLVALLDRSDQDHEKAKSLFSKLSPPFVTCESVLSEACFLTGRKEPKIPQKIVSLGKDGFYKVSFVLEEHWTAIATLLADYCDQSISLADACLIRLAEIHNEPRILTFDADFGVYRWGRNKQFEIIR